MSNVFVVLVWAASTDTLRTNRNAIDARIAMLLGETSCSGCAYHTSCPAQGAAQAAHCHERRSRGPMKPTIALAWIFCLLGPAFAFGQTPAPPPAPTDTTAPNIPGVVAGG